MILTVVHVWLVALALLLGAGYGISRWLTPPALKPYELWLLPLWGYGLLVFVAYYGLQTIITLRASLVLVLVVALVLAVWRLQPWRGRSASIDRVPRAPWIETLVIVAIALLAGLVGVVPLLRAGYLLPIGHGWDIEFYLPLAQYLQDYTYAQLAQAPTAPLLDVVRAVPTSVRAIGFSYLHGMIDLLGGWAATGTFPLLLAFVRALAIVPIFLLLRVGLRATRAGAAVGALLVAGNELLQWISFNNFAMHVSSMPLVPLATLLTLLALAPPADQVIAPARRFWQGHTHALGGAIAATTALTLSYHPALLAYGALAAGLGVWAIIYNRDKLATVLRGATIITGCLILGGLAHWRAPRAFFDVYQVQTPSIGGNRFARVTELLGVEAFHHLSLAVDGPGWLIGASWLALAGLIVGLGVALWHGAVWRGPALGLLLFALLYALGLRFVIAFPYGFYKGVSYLSFVPLGIAGAGLAHALRLPQRSVRLRIVRPVLASALLLLVGGMTGWSTYRLLETYRVPVLAKGDVVAFADALRAVPGNDPVLLVDHPEMRGPKLGLALMGLYGHAWVGRGQTGFALFNHSEPGVAAAYALMHRSEDPRAWGFEPEDAVVQGQTMVLYQAPPGGQAFLSGTAAAYDKARGSLGSRLNSLEVQDLTHGDFQTIQADRPLYLHAPDQRLQWGPGSAGAPPQIEQIELQLASAAPQILTITTADGDQALAVPVGVSRVTTAAINVADTVALRAESTIIVRSVHLIAAVAGRAAGVAPLLDTLAIQTITQPADQALQTEITVVGAEPHVLHFGLELYEVTEGTPRHYAGGSLAVRANQPATLALDLQTPAATLNGGTIGLSAGDLQDGEYFAALWLYHGSTLARRVPFARFERRDGTVINVTSLDTNATFARTPLVDQPVVADLDAAAVTGYSIAGGPIRPGAELQLGIQWRAQSPSPDPLLVFAQVLGPDDRKWAAWDGIAGGDWWPSPAWQAGDLIRQDVPLTLDPATPPGRYRLAIGMYKASTGERVSVGGPLAQGGLIVLSEIEVAP